MNAVVSKSVTKAQLVSRVWDYKNPAEEESGSVSKSLSPKHHYVFIKVQDFLDKIEGTEGNLLTAKRMVAKEMGEEYKVVDGLYRSAAKYILAGKKFRMYEYGVPASLEEFLTRHFAHVTCGEDSYMITDNRCIVYLEVEERRAANPYANLSSILNTLSEQMGTHSNSLRESYLSAADYFVGLDTDSFFDSYRKEQRRVWAERVAIENKTSGRENNTAPVVQTELSIDGNPDALLQFAEHVASELQEKQNLKKQLEEVTKERDMYKASYEKMSEFYKSLGVLVSDTKVPLEGVIAIPSETPMNQ